MKYLFISCVGGLLLFVSCKKSNAPEIIVPASKSPIANAGPDTTIILPATHLTLDGTRSTDPNNRPLEFRWKKLSGPNHISFASSLSINPVSPQVEMDCHESGECLIELTVTNDMHLSSKDTLKVTVVHSAVSEHSFDYIFDKDGDCRITGTFPTDKPYVGASFSLSAGSTSTSKHIYVVQEYERYIDDYFYPASVVVKDMISDAIFFYFPSQRNFFTLPYTAGPTVFFDSVAIDYGTGKFTNIMKDHLLYCSVTADTTNHIGKIRLQGSVYY